MILCHDVGYTESAMTGSVFQLAAMDESIGYARRITRGIEVNEDTLAVDVIHNVGPNGHYLRENTYRAATTRTNSGIPIFATDATTRNGNRWARQPCQRPDRRPGARILATHEPRPIKARNRESNRASFGRSRRTGQRKADIDGRQLGCAEQETKMSEIFERLATAILEGDAEKTPELVAKRPGARSRPQRNPG